MRRLIIILLGIFAFTHSLFAAAYDAPSLHNSVKRSSSVQALFFERWKYMEENKYTFDLFGKFNWVNKFQIYTTDRLTQEKKPQDMKLTRTYGGLSLLLPLSKESSGKADMVLGLTTTGYHYGLTKKSSIKRGDAGSETVKDYKYSQFFDDIFAASLLYSSYFYAHAGILLNNEIVPRDDGTMRYSSSSMTAKWFISSTVLLFFNFNFLIEITKIETFDVSVNVNKLYAFFSGPPHKLIPALTIGVNRTAMYNDDDLDAVWVKSDKTGLAERDSAYLTMLTLLVEENFYDRLYIECFAAWQRASETLIEKRTGGQLPLKPLKELRSAVSYDLASSPGVKAAPGFGCSFYWDESMPVHTRSNSHSANGFFGSFELSGQWKNAAIGTKLTFSYNDSNELKSLIETANKLAVEWEFYVSARGFEW